jgi:hypothetical protein
LAYLQGDFGSAQSLASECNQRLSIFVSDSSVADSAAQERAFDFWVNMVHLQGRFVPVAGFVVWRFIKRYVPVEAENEVQTESTRV